MRSPGDGFLRPCVASLWPSGLCTDATWTPDSRRRLEGESTAAASDPDSSPDALPVEKWRDSRLGSLVVLLGKDMPGKPSPLVVSILCLGVGVGSTDTTDLMGKTRSEADGLIAPNGDSEEGDVIGEFVPCISFLCKLGLHGTRWVSEPHSAWSSERAPEKERWRGDNGGGNPVVDESGAFGTDADLPGHILLQSKLMIGPWALSCRVFQQPLIKDVCLLAMAGGGPR